jgi:3-deoxy-manno-octulosonate cytidylyltransferase (CMP-KDO synthetase)
MKRAVFLDRDGTIVVEKNYLCDPEQVELLPGTDLALRRLQDAGFLLVIVTNQSGIGRGYYTVKDMELVNARIENELAKAGVMLSNIYFAPEAPEEPSRGRKPSPQFLWDARDEFKLDLSKSFMVGDKLIDLECGWNAGVHKSILVRTGYGVAAEKSLGPKSKQAVVVNNLQGAADWILSQTDLPSAGTGASRIVGVIPARYASSRFPGKPLARIAGKPLIQHVIEQCQKAHLLADVIVATDDPRIREAVEKFCPVEMTRSDHPSGSDRIAEVVARRDCTAVVNVQGDEPLIAPEVIDAVAGALAHAEMSTAATRIRDPAEYADANSVKVVVTQSGQALYFSRHPIPYVRDAADLPSAEQLLAFPFLKHLGIYGYRRETLLRLVQWPVSPLERAEKLEQLRALEHGIRIQVVEVAYESIGVDTPEDVQRVEQRLTGNNRVK